MKNGDAIFSTAAGGRLQPRANSDNSDLTLLRNSSGRARAVSPLGVRSKSKTRILLKAVNNPLIMARCCGWIGGDCRPVKPFVARRRGKEEENGARGYAAEFRAGATSAAPFRALIQSMKALSGIGRAM